MRYSAEAAAILLLLVNPVSTTLLGTVIGAGAWATSAAQALLYFAIVLWRMRTSKAAAESAPNSKDN